MKVFTYYVTDPEGIYFSRFLEPVEVADRDEAERIDAKLVKDAKTQSCVTATQSCVTDEAERIGAKLVKDALLN